jgi:DNA-binding response OmpR family regulator
MGATGSAKRALLLVEDAMLGRFLEMNLQLNGLDVLTETTQKRALDSSFEWGPDVFIVEVSEAGVSSLRDLVRRLRASRLGVALPILTVLPQLSTADKVALLTVGIDRCIFKPFDTAEFVARAVGLDVQEIHRGHRWGEVVCVRCSAIRDVYSTPRNPATHAKQIDRFVAQHSH